MLKMLLCCFMFTFLMTSITGQCKQCCIPNVKKYSSCFKHCVKQSEETKEYAHNKATMQSTTKGFTTVAFASSDLAVDGNKNPNYGARSCSHTLQEPHPWWSVDLGTSVKVTCLNITNRGDCCSDRLNNMSVYVSNVSGNPNTATDKQLCFFRAPAFGATLTLTCTTPLTGRYVIIKINSGFALTLCEVEVFGTDI